MDQRKKLEQTTLTTTLKRKGMHARLIPTKSEDLECAENNLSPFKTLLQRYNHSNIRSSNFERATG